ncbi:MAG TPA: GntR family transcriptional regulator, partial [Tepidisphaeraceae bacterium]|nr:GntR family transcriptional regulator [Tepidisphaeraceae bacterium]
YDWIQHMRSPLTKSPTFNLRQQAYDRIRELLRAGDISPGERVSSLGLSKRLGISRTPVREALSRLCADGVVREVPGFGVLVHIPDAGELRELYAMREVLECFAAKEAAINITPDELTRLQELLLQWRGIARYLRDSKQPRLETRLHDRWIKIDEKFHEIVLAAARNQLLTKTVDDMRLTSRVLEARCGEDDLSLGPAAKTILDHSRLYRALQKRDAAAAEYWMRQQLSMGRERHLAELRDSPTNTE